MAAPVMVDEVTSLSLVAAARALREALSGFEPALLSGEDAVLAVQELALTEKVCASARVRAAARAAECGEHRRAGCARPERWLAKKTGQTSGQALRQLDTASKLAAHPRTKGAVDRGELSLNEAEEVIRTEEEAPGSEDEMLDEVKRNGLDAAKDKGRRLRQGGTDVKELDERRKKARSVRTWTDDLGMVNVFAKLLPEPGQRFLARLEAETERQWRSGNRESTLEQRAHDAFLAMLEGKGKGSSRRPDAIVVINPDADTAHLPSHGPITMESAKAIARDAVITVVLHDGKKITDYKRWNRTIPRELETLLELGDPPEFDGMVCVDCGKRFRPQIDHVDPCANGGPTTFENLDPRCYPCHKAKTERDRQAGLLGPP